MLRTLFYVPLSIGGVPLFGFGLLLFVWLGLTGGAALWMWRRRGPQTDWLSHLLLALLGAAVIVVVVPAIAEPEGLPIRGYGVMMLAAVLAAIALAVARARQRGWDADMIYSLAFWVFVPGIVGARAFYVIEYWSRDFAPAFDVGIAAGIGSLLNVTRGGLVVFGSLIGAVVGLVAFALVRRLPLPALCDLVVPSFALGQALGRIGCLLNGCCFGGECDLPWAVTFPIDSPPYLAQLDRGLQFGLLLSSEGSSCAAGGGCSCCTPAPTNTPEAGGRSSRGQGAVRQPGMDADHGAAAAAHRAAGADEAAGAERAAGANQFAGVGQAGAGRAAEGGLTVQWIDADSPLARQGIAAGDRLQAINGRPLPTIDAAAEVFRFAALNSRPLEFAFAGKPPVIVEPNPLPARSRPVHPAQLYSAIDALLLCLLLLAVEPYLKYDGQLFALGLGLHAVSRFLLEIIRIDESAVFGTGLSISQNISVGMLAVALVLGVWFTRLRQRRMRPGRVASPGPTVRP